MLLSPMLHLIAARRLATEQTPRKGGAKVQAISVSRIRFESCLNAALFWDGNSNRMMTFPESITGEREILQTESSKNDLLAILAPEASEILPSSIKQVYAAGHSAGISFGVLHVGEVGLWVAEGWQAF
ncbi:MAG: hypothetical protein M2R45_04159 [Verrucomicrobia subdivision 3 bacterium]|nr:hypothetical protein [Limisphaerales bacterium]MCS1413035.1 hypothetical protein [Limisphaerales bacterium]